MIEDLTHTAIQKKLQPPARWRNWWRSKTHCRVHCKHCSREEIIDPGVVFCFECHADQYPDQEVAEIVASRAPDFWKAGFDYAGAYRVGERP